MHEKSERDFEVGRTCEEWRFSGHASSGSDKLRSSQRASLVSSSRWTTQLGQAIRARHQLLNAMERKQEEAETISAMYVVTSPEPVCRDVTRMKFGWPTRLAG